ncbi:hypothetical protein PM082_012412 [Marasmius tenuissimus]|nr:hypothetical protein PM082_012412 [Marasmius tenuissimus]
MTSTWLPKSRRQRLFEQDHDAIWLFHLQNPTARHEDIASHFNVCRSSITRLLKQLALGRPVIDFIPKPSQASRTDRPPEHHATQSPNININMDLDTPIIRFPKDTHADFHFLADTINLSGCKDTALQTVDTGQLGAEPASDDQGSELISNFGGAPMLQSTTPGPPPGISPPTSQS